MSNKKVFIKDVLESISINKKFNKDEKVYPINTSDILNGNILPVSNMEFHLLKGQFKKTFKTGDILFSEIRPSNKRFVLVPTGEYDKFLASTKLMVLRNKSNEFSTRFLYYFITRDFF